MSPVEIAAWLTATARDIDDFPMRAAPAIRALIQALERPDAAGAIRTAPEQTRRALVELLYAVGTALDDTPEPNIEDEIPA